MYCSIDDEDGFVSIDLDDEFEECDICHQATNERIVNVILSDEFTTFEGSHEKHCGSLTKAHQICLNKWAEIIERNIKISKKTNSPNLKDTREVQPNTDICDKLKEEDKKLFVEKKTSDDVFELCEKSAKQEILYKSKDEEQLLKLNCENIRAFLSQLDNIATETSCSLVEQLQLRDRLHQEISAQKTLIAQLVKMEKTTSSPVPTKTNMAM